MPFRNNNRIRKLFLDLLLDQLPAVESELSEEFPALIGVSISAPHNCYGALGSGDRSVGVGSLPNFHLSIRYPGLMFGKMRH